MPYNSSYRRSFTLAPEYDTGERWIISWETRRPESGNWSEAVEKSQAGAIERAKHLLRLGFIVFQITGPAGGVFMTEEEITQRLQLPSAVNKLRSTDETPPTAST
jgi:hypothetical protein